MNIDVHAADLIGIAMAGMTINRSWTLLLHDRNIQKKKAPTDYSDGASYVILEETEGVEPSMRVLAHMLP